MHLDIQAPQVIALINIFIQSEKPLNRQELQNLLGLKNRKHFRERYLKPPLRLEL
ncbi:Fic family protein [Pseudoalteromonas sp. SK20]|uniref:Fic family protein n=1 Tax=Pseudoalteromonas sp. SK20 TaxID=1938367 RepID=UPI0034C5CA58